MYRYSPIRNQRSKGIKTKHVVQLCLLAAVCFWLIFQVKRSHDKKKEFDANISLNTRADHDETVQFGRKDLHPKLEETTTRIETHEDEQDENKHEDEDKIEEEKDDGGGGGDDEIDEKSNVEIDRDEVDIIDEDKETEDGQSQTENTVEQEKSNMEFDRDEVDTVDEDDKVNEESEEKDGQSQTENTEIDREEVDIVDEDDKANENKVEQEKSNIEIDHDEVDEDKTTEESEGKDDGQSQTENRVEDGSTEHTHEAREEHYKADDASSAVLTHDPENEIKNGTLSDVGLVENNVTETTPNLTQMLNIEENTSSDESRHLDNE